MASGRQRKRGGYRCNFVQELPKSPEFKCPVCSLVPRDPHLTTCCGRNVCLSCIPAGTAKRGARLCPLCKGSLTAVKNRSLNNEIQALEVYCCFKGRGCDWKGTLDGYEKHVGTCGYALTECKYCGGKVQQRRFDDHLRQVCTRYPIPCPTCGKGVARSNLQEHTRTECPLISVTCPFSQLGCGVMVQRKDLGAHLSSTFHRHLTLVKDRNDLLQTESLEKKKELVSQEEKKSRESEEEVKNLQELLHESQLQANVFQKLIGQAEQDVKHLHLEQRQGRERFEADMAARDAEILRLKQNVWQLQEQMKTKYYGPPLPKFAVIHSRPHPPVREVPVLPLTMQIIDFTNRQKNNVVWIRPFYTHKYGYKMCLVVYTNGVARFRGHWISVYVSLVKGDYDAHLRWPYRGKIVLTIYNQSRNANHVTHTIVFSDVHDLDNDAGKRVTDGCLAETRLGLEQAVLQRFLNPSSPWANRCYLKNDCLEIGIKTSS